MVAITTTPTRKGRACWSCFGVFGLASPIGTSLPGAATGTAAIGLEARHPVETAAAPGDTRTAGEHLEREPADGERKDQQGEEQFQHRDHPPKLSSRMLSSSTPMPYSIPMTAAVIIGGPQR